VRHGEAAARAPGASDDERRLTERGELESTAAGRGLCALGAAPERVLTSPLRRALETAALLARELGSCEPEIWPALGADADPVAILAGLAGPFERVVLVGHQPTLGEVATLAMAGVAAAGAALGTGGAARLDFEGRPRPGAGRLRWLLTAEQLGALGG
jgi:phosphohistidine phosphatase